VNKLHSRWVRSAVRVRKLPTPLPVLESVDTDNGRFYQTPDGQRYQSVTTFLGSLPKASYLDEWLARVGEDYANKIKRQGANRGSRLHDAIERYLQGEVVETTNPLDNILFTNIVPFLKRIDSIIAMEASLFSHTLKLAGRCDLIATINNVPFVIDFKTMTEEKEIPKEYWLQTTAYSIMFHEMTGINIPNLCIAAVTDDGMLKVEFSEAKLWTKKLKTLLTDPSQIHIL
jgi:ATP-dependent exoDNAse (exonuclease V) beta subunit